jgi:L-ascorbate metabolism protein UlaG (beta-lactamase superfamily)
MVNDPHFSSAPSPILRGKQALQRKLQALHCTDLQVGLLPKKGWYQRNRQFFGGVLLPSLLAPRGKGHAVGELQEVGEHELSVTWLGHAGFLIQTQGLRLLVDPNWALWHGPVKRVRHPSLSLDQLPEVDLVLVTHAHFDHLHMPTLRRVAAGQPIVLPTGCGELVRRLNFSKVVELKTWEGYSFRDLRITLTPARHWGARMIHDTHRQFGGYLIESEDHTVFHCGDSALFEGFREIGQRARIDLALMPIGAYDAPSGRPVHMNPEEAIEAFLMLGAKHFIPMHHDTFPLGSEPMHEPAERLVKSAASYGISPQVSVLREGESWKK